MAHDLKLFFAILPIFLTLDYLWLGRIMPRFYLGELGDLARREGDTMKPRLLAAAGVYLALPATAAGRRPTTGSTTSGSSPR